MTPMYSPRLSCVTGWGFRTPTGRSTGFESFRKAKDAATATEAQDRAEARTGNSVIATVLRRYFAEEEGDS